MFVQEKQGSIFNASEHPYAQQQPRFAMNSEDERSTDGSDNGSDLEDFLVDDSEEEEMLSTDDEESEAATLLKEFPYEKSLLEDGRHSGPRRSRRTRVAVQRYQDPDFLKMMLDDADPDDVLDDDSKLSAPEEDSDEDFEELSDIESDISGGED